MAKMIFNKEETKNLINMLRSEDADNHLIAFETLKNVDYAKYIGELLVMYKFGGHTSENWHFYCDNIHKKLSAIVPIGSLTGPQTLSLMIEHKASNKSIELFMEFFLHDMTKMLGSIGYPVDIFEIEIKMKE